MGSNGNNRKLLSPEREDLILAALGDGVRTIAELAGALQVSEATVRRDLHSLENRGAVQRVHGGAIRVGGDDEKREPLFHEKTTLRAAEKERIAEAALARCCRRRDRSSRRLR